MREQSLSGQGSADVRRAGFGAPEKYVEYTPAPALGSYVECFWSRRAPTPGDPPSAGRVLPDGCIDIVLGFGNAVEPALVVGTMTRPLLVGPSERSSLVGVRFRPGKACALLPVPASELTDLRVPLADVWRNPDAALDQVSAAQGPAARVRAMERALLARLGSAPAVAPEVDAAVRMILGTGGNLSIASVGPALGVTRQHLTRRFTQLVGVSPKMFARVVRARRLMARLRQESEIHWSAVALEAGYYDQSHLISDFRALTGLTPSRWLAGR